MSGWAEREAQEGEAQENIQGETTEEEGRFAADVNGETKGSEEGEEGRSGKSRVTRKRVRSRWLRDFVMAEQR
ncbi:hypothetical protein L484_018123 [Morus notabilis]|uniref:Uncharacterized protein n=1 Tax=Morus notabilis TaxID=981085 RepID=W9QVL6_9ROSA|nr:hypothetical protein L484_018123 [Morus notabilis]